MLMANLRTDFALLLKKRGEAKDGNPNKKVTLVLPELVKGDEKTNKKSNNKNKNNIYGQSSKDKKSKDFETSLRFPELSMANGMKYKPMYMKMAYHYGDTNPTPAGVPGMAREYLQRNPKPDEQQFFEANETKLY